MHNSSLSLSLSLIVLFVSGCTHHIPEADYKHLSQMSCPVLEAEMNKAYWHYSDLSSHRENAPYHHKLSNMAKSLVGHMDQEGKDLQKAKETYNNMATMYNKKRCGAYQTLIQVPVS
tara:strand:- start:604 stop:954 length:351 start_codon:yes stop_codon:yes gene_type:complete